MSARVLNDIIVVDRGHGMPSALAAKLLRELGATVYRDVPEDAEPAGTIYPADPVLREGTVRISPGPQLDGMMARADICLLGGEDFPGVARTGDAEELCGRFPRLVALDIAAYPACSPFSGRPACDILIQASSGICAESLLDRPAAYSFSPSSYGAAMRGVAAVLAALVEREHSGMGQIVRTSLLEGALAWCVPTWYETEVPNPAGEVPRGVRPLVFRCADGRYVHMSFSGHGAVSRAYSALGIADPVVLADTGPARYGDSPENFFGDTARIAAHLSKHSSDWVIATLQKADVAIGLVRAPGECWADPQAEVNAIIERAPSGVRRVGSPFSLETRADGTKPGRKPARGGPLAGFKVLDLGQFVAMPMATRIMAEMGAQVIKVEPTRPAIGPTWQASNTGKLSLLVNLKAEAGKQVIERLCGEVDLVASNFRPGVLDRLGFGVDKLLNRHPGLCIVESPGFGSKGPQVLEAAFDMIFQASCGHEVRAGGEGNPPAWNSTAMVDVCAGMLNAVAAVACLYHRVRTGKSCTSQVALLDAAIFLMSELIQLPNGSFVGAPPLNHRRTGYHPAEAFYQCRDGWIAVAARDDAAARGLADALQIAGKVPGARVAWGEAEDALITAALLHVPVAEARQRLEASGVWTELCADRRLTGILRDPQLEAAGILLWHNHPPVGEVAQIARLQHFSRSDSRDGLQGVNPGQHTAAILQELQFGPEAIDRMYEDGAVA